MHLQDESFPTTVNFRAAAVGLLYKVPTTVKHTCALSLDFYVNLISKWIFLVDLESELFPINVNTRLCDKHCFTNSKVTQKLGWCLYNFITMSMTGCGVKVASQTVKSIKLGWCLASLLPRSGSTSCLTCKKRGTWLLTSQLNQSRSQPTETSYTMEKILTLTILALCLFATTWARAQPNNLSKGSFSTTNMTWIWPGSGENAEIKKTCQVQGPDFCGQKLWKDGSNIKCGSTKKEWLQAVQQIMGLFSAEEKRECNFNCYWIVSMNTCCEWRSQIFMFQISSWLLNCWIFFRFYLTFTVT